MEPTETERPNMVAALAGDLTMNQGQPLTTSRGWDCWAWTLSAGSIPHLQGYSSLDPPGPHHTAAYLSGCGPTALGFRNPFPLGRQP